MREFSGLFAIASSKRLVSRAQHKTQKTSVAREGLRWRLASLTKPHALFSPFFCTETQLTERLLEEANL